MSFSYFSLMVQDVASFLFWMFLMFVQHIVLDICCIVLNKQHFWCHNSTSGRLCVSEQNISLLEMTKSIVLQVNGRILYRMFSFHEYKVASVCPAFYLRNWTLALHNLCMTKQTVFCYYLLCSQARYQSNGRPKPITPGQNGLLVLGPQAWSGHHMPKKASHWSKAAQ